MRTDSSESATHRLWRNVLFVVVVPGVVAGLGPWLVTRWHVSPWGPWGWLVVPVACILILTGAGVLLHAVWRFAREGLGTPAPISPTRRLVVGGIYRHVRNPMYLAVGAVIAGQVLISPSPQIVLYFIAFATAVAIFVRMYEEPTLRATYADEYERYVREVPGWIPRRVPRDGRREI